MFGSLPKHRAPAERRTPRADRYAGIAAGPAERDTATTTSSGYLGDVGVPFEVVARVAGTMPRQTQDAPDIIRHCFRTVDAGLALCCPLPAAEKLRLGTVIRVRGTVTAQRTQGLNDVTEIDAETIERIG